MMSTVMVEQRVPRTSWPPLLHRVVKTVRARALFEPGQHLLVAVSGGPDSVALLRLLHRLSFRWRLRLTAVHCNYGLRGRESEEDQAFVMALCESLAVPLRCIALDVRARPRRVSLQAQARELRYSAMARLAEDVEADRIVVGHTADDQAETVLLWMLRGAGLTGLAGMPAQRDGVIVRPLYEVSRRHLVSFLDEAGQSYRQDSSNAKRLYTRNRIRHELVPVLTRIAPAAMTALCRTADLCREDDQYLDEQAQTLGSSLIRVDSEGRYSVDRHQFLAQAPALQRRLVRQLFRGMHPVRRVPAVATIELVRRLFSSKPGGPRRYAGGVHVRVTQAAVVVQPGGIPSAQLDSVATGEMQVGQLPAVVEWVGTGQQIRVQEWAQESYQHAVSPGWSMLVDADLLSLPLRIRPWRTGDRFVPSGMQGRSKKLQDYFVDCKVPKERRELIPILEAPQGIVGVLGFRQDERFQVSDRTRRCLVISIDDGSIMEGAH